MLLEHS